METFIGVILLLIGIGLSISFIAVGKKMIYTMVPYTGRYFTRPAVVTLAFTMMICLVVGAVMVFEIGGLAIGTFMIFGLPGAGIFARKFEEAKKEHGYAKAVGEMERDYGQKTMGDIDDLKKFIK